MHIRRHIFKKKKGVFEYSKYILRVLPRVYEEAYECNENFPIFISDSFLILLFIKDACNKAVSAPYMRNLKIFEQF